jgi:hypothetical protein
MRGQRFIGAGVLRITASISIKTRETVRKMPHFWNLKTAGAGLDFFGVTKEFVSKVPRSDRGRVMESAGTRT